MDANRSPRHTCSHPDVCGNYCVLSIHGDDILYKNIMYICVCVCI